MTSVVSCQVEVNIFHTKPLSTMEKRSARKYTAKFKLQVVGETEESSNVQATNLFGIGESSVRNWRKQKEKGNSF